MQSFVLDVLDSSIQSGTVNSEGIPRLLSQALKFLSVVPTTNCVEKLKALTDRIEQLSFTDCANFLGACANQKEGEGDTSSASLTEMAQCSRKVHGERLLISKDAWCEPIVCSSFARSIRRFGQYIIVRIQNHKYEASVEQMSLSDLTSVLSVNLSSHDIKLRSACLSLLFALDRLSASNNAVQACIQRLRESTSNKAQR